MSLRIQQYEEAVEDISAYIVRDITKQQVDHLKKKEEIVLYCEKATDAEIETCVSLLQKPNCLCAQVWP